MLCGMGLRGRRVTVPFGPDVLLPYVRVLLV